MSPSSLHTRLPTETLQMVFSNLGHNDIRRLLEVNSYIKAVAQSFTYRRGIYTQFGLHFPDAPVPLPFFDNPDPRVPRLSEEERLNITRNVEHVEVNVHSCDECRTCLSIIPVKFIPEPRVLSMTVESFEDDSPYVHNDSFPPSGYDSLPFNSLSPDPVDCYYLEPTRGGLKFQKLIIRDYPVLPNSDVTLPRSCTPKHVVGVVSTPSSPNSERYRLCERIAPADGHTMWRYAPTADVLTLVFWTRSPSEEWMPPCKHFYIPYSLTSLAGRNCMIIENLWSDLSDTLERHMPGSPSGRSPVSTPKQRVRIINAAAVVPPNTKREQHLKNLDEGVATHQAAQKFLLSRPESTALLETGHVSIDFQTMQEWINTGQWEDVFTEEEMRPWLDSMTHKD